MKVLAWFGLYQRSPASGFDGGLRLILIEPEPEPEPPSTNIVAIPDVLSIYEVLIPLPSNLRAVIP